MTRVLVVADRVGAAPPPAAGAAIARAFVDASPRVQAAVVPAAAGGPDLAAALTALGSPAAALPWRDASSLAAALEGEHGGPADALVLIDLSAPDDRADAPGALGVAEALGLVGSGAPERLAALRARLAGRALTAVVADEERSVPLLGLQGAAARAGFAAGWDAARVRRLEDAHARLASTLCAVDAPGSGAAGGAAAVLAALGARIATGVELCREAAVLDATLPKADLVVVASDSFTIGNFGGPVVLEVARLAGEHGVPVLAVAREVDISLRELRRHGVEQAVPLGGGPELTASEITGRAGRIAAGWAR